ncbi:hypothetical protein [Arthrobacter sp. UYCu712]
MESKNHSGAGTASPAVPKLIRCGRNAVYIDPTEADSFPGVPAVVSLALS